MKKNNKNSGEKTFVTIFLEAKDVHINKDVGAIPRTFERTLGYKSFLVCREKINIELSDLNIINIGSNVLYSEIKILLFLIVNAKKIDVLNLYHWGRKTLFLSRIYKFFNSKGKLYVKCDLDSRGLNKIKKDRRVRKVFNKILDIADVMTCESKWIQKELNKLFFGKMCYLPNGFFGFNAINHITEKEKYILTVGRLGTEQKATEILVQSFISICEKYPEWKLLLVGIMTDDFQMKINEMLEKDGGVLKDRIIIVGEVNDKSKLSSIYQKSRIFALPSRWESFALVMLEAISNGCYFVGTSGIAPVFDVITDEKLGYIANPDDVEEFTMLLEKAMNCEEFFSLDTIQYRKEYAYKNFEWDIICKNLYDMLRKVD